MHDNHQKHQQRKQSTSPFRKAALWNALDPNDPYDIKKSMIARLPQHPPRFMGDNLQLVCLFQAAQIQRLALYLQQMTNKIRQAERIQLDRHSYEIQIKQLADKLTLLNGVRIKNQKLEQFIKRQSEEMQILKQQKRSSENLVQLQNKYDSLLNQLRITRQNHQALQKSNNELIKQITEWRYKYEKTQRLFSQQRLRFQNQLKIKIQSSINEFKRNFEAREYQLKGENNVLKQNLTLKNQEIQYLNSKLQSLSKILSEKQNQLSKYQIGQIETQNSKMQEFLKISKRLEEMTYELEQTKKSNSNLKNQLSFLTTKNKKIEQELLRRDQQLKWQKQSKQSNYQLKIAENQNKIAMINIQIQHLSEQNERKKRQILTKEQQIKEYQQKLSLYERKTQTIERTIRQKDERIRRLEMDFNINQDKDSRIEVMANEIIKLNFVLQDKLNQIKKLQLKINQIINGESHSQTILKSKQQTIRILESRIRQYQMKMYSFQDTSKLNNEQISKMNMRIMTLEGQNNQLKKQIQLLNQSNVTVQQYQNKLARMGEQFEEKVIQNRKLREDNQHMYSQIKNSQFMQTKFNDQINFLNTKIQQKTNQINFMNLKIQQKSNQIGSLTTKLQEKNNEVTHLTHQLSQYKMIQTSFITKQKHYIDKVESLQTSIPRLSEEINRLHDLLQTKKTENSNLIHDLEKQRQKLRNLERRKSTEYEMSTLQYEKKISFLQSKCNNLQKQCLQLKDQKENIIIKNQKSQHLQFEYQKQLERFKSTLQNKEQIIIQLDKRNLTLQNLIKEQSNRKQTLFSENNSLKLMIQSLRTQLLNSSNQYQQLQYSLNEYKTKQTLIQQQNFNLTQKVNEYQQKIKHIEISNQRFVDENRNSLVRDYEGKLRSVNQKYQELEKRLQTNQTELDRKNNECLNAQDEIQLLRRNLNESRNKILKYQEQVTMLSLQIQRLLLKMQSPLQKDQTMIQQLKRQLNQTNIELTNLKQALEQYQSINQHTVAERDELFKISHDQQHDIQDLKITISKQKGYYEEQLGNMLQKYNIKMREVQEMKVTNTSEKNLQQTLRQYKSTIQYKQNETQRLVEKYQSLLLSQRKKVQQASVNIEKQARALFIVQEQKKKLQNQLKQLQIQLTHAQNLRVEQIKTQYVNIRTQNEQLIRKLQQMNDEIFYLQQEKKQTQNLHKQYQIILDENQHLHRTIANEKQRYRLIEEQLKNITNQIQIIKSSSELQIKQVQTHYFPIIQQNDQNKRLIEDYKVKITQLSNQLSIHQQFSLEWERKYHTLYQAYNQMYSAYNEMKGEYEMANQKIRQFQSKFPLYEVQFNKLSQLVQQLKKQKKNLSLQLQDYDELIQKNKRLSEQIDQLYRIIKSQKQQIAEVRIRLSNDNALQRRIQEDMALMVILFAEIESLRKRVEETQKQSQDVRRSSLSPFKVERNKRKTQIFK